MNIKKQVNLLVNKYNTNDPYELIELLDINLYFDYNLSKSTKGFYIEEYGEKNICINGNLDDRSKYIVAAHELGHAILHEGHNIYFIRNNTLCNTEKAETQANVFAANLLIDDNIFKKYENYTLDYISKWECIPKELLILKYSSLYNN